jgi:hypothetical protein
MKTLYLGSCRYMYNYIWEYFPARLHTTREIIFFLKNINNLKNIISTNPIEITNYIFGGIYHEDVINDSKKFINNLNSTDLKNINKLILEISSRKIMYYNDIPLNYYYCCNNFSAIQKYNITEKILTSDEINIDLDCIIQLSKLIFNENIEIHIIPHLNLKSKLNNEYIYERNILVNLLEDFCNEKKIKIHNIGKYIEKNNVTCFIEDYMPDSTHYDCSYDHFIKSFLNNMIFE